MACTLSGRRSFLHHGVHDICCCYWCLWWWGSMDLARFTLVKGPASGFLRYWVRPAMSFFSFLFYFFHPTYNIVRWWWVWCDILNILIVPRGFQDFRIVLKHSSSPFTLSLLYPAAFIYSFDQIRSLSTASTLSINHEHLKGYFKVDGQRRRYTGGDRCLFRYQYSLRRVRWVEEECL